MDNKPDSSLWASTEKQHNIGIMLPFLSISNEFHCQSLEGTIR